jgi:hypothetical protein
MVRDMIIGKDIKSKNKQGYVSYFNNYVRLGTIYEILNIDMDNNKEFAGLGKLFSSNVLDKLISGKVYRMLVSVKYEVDGIVKGGSPMKSIMITTTISSKLILERIQRELIRFEYEYNLEEYSADCFVGWKE